ncbi:MAG: phenylacetic acid degradation operon negative regulatory protein PaaX [Burkholderiales bacterium]|nr:phenylacetic acid degradation operon negative regulatory protein PaaX [Burkholderiales bacterium]
MKIRAVDEALHEYLRARPLRTKSLVVTVFGDAIAPHGGTVWLGGLIRLLASFGVNERAVRTTVFRLAREHWLRGEQVGRRSHYTLTESGRRRFEAAFRKIYAASTGAWDGRWCLVIGSGDRLSPARRRALRDELAWMGFGRFAGGVMAHPAIDEDAVAAILQEHEAEQHLLVMNATADASFPDTALGDAVQHAWDFARLERDYRAFLDRFRPVLQLFQRHPEGKLDPEQCFMVRTLLIHEYRRVMLRDPLLPEQLLPQHWPGSAARLLCRNLYRLTQRLTEQHLMATLQTPEGPLPQAAPYFFARFGGLAQADAGGAAPTAAAALAPVSG